MRYYRFQRTLSTPCMPQGLCNALATFQQIMDTILSDLKYSCVLFFDNTNVFSRTFNEHLEHLEQVFIRLAKNNLKLKPKKCHLFKSLNRLFRFYC